MTYKHKPWVDEANKNKENKKERPCLRCDKKFITTPEHRLCNNCTDSIREFGLNSGLDYYNHFGTIRGG